MSESPAGLQCPPSLSHYDCIVMAHGGGGRLMQQLLDDIIRPAFANEWLDQRHDSAVLPVTQRCAFTTDSYVIHPLIFPGGDIGKLAVCGTLNDLAMAGARPAYLSVGFILEEGLPLATLRQIIHSMAVTAHQAGVSIVTGDIKVVEWGKADGLYINTSGIGLLETERWLHPGSLRPGDAILLNGDVGRHGIAVMAKRNQLAFEPPLESDCADLSGLIHSLLTRGMPIHCLRDLTRGGLATALIELAGESGLAMELEEAAIPVSAAVEGACELLGLDPLFVANEGRFVLCLPEAHADDCLARMRAHPLGANACRIGRIVATPDRRVLLQTRLGTARRLLLPSGEQLPRIC